MNTNKNVSQRTRSLTKTAGVFTCSLIILGIGSFVWAQQYQGRIAPRVTIGSVAVGGLDPETARQRVQKRVDTVLTNGYPVIFEGNRKTVPLNKLVGSQMVEDVDMDVETAVERAQNAARHTHPLVDTVRLIWNLKQPVHVRVPVVLHNDKIRSSVRDLYPDRETPRRDAQFDFSATPGGWTADVTPGASGQGFHFSAFEETLRKNLSNIQLEPITLKRSVRPPTVSATEAEQMTEAAVAVLNQAPYTFLFQENGRTQRWSLPATRLATMLKPQEHRGTVRLGVERETLNTFLDTPAKTIERPARDARFQIENGRVIEFTGSRTGRQLDRNAIYNTLIETINMPTDEQTEISLAVKTTEPDVTTDEVNDFGITEVLGVGTSNYAGSPINRIKNIRNGVNLLDGRLIKPGETFSLISALKPFTFENGYLPELVIKGDRIEPEIGGGLCQIGTTTFRSTMNAGLPIKARTNHSLVVSYYNDPSNGNPGTDATLYDPAPDFKFTNDTGHHILFQAQMLPETQQLKFTFWGTSDGREGSYSAPVVHRWIPTGEPKQVETTDLEPGEEKCQSAHVGADASFTYTVVQPNGEVKERVFRSHYRPLPKICLIGVEEKSDEDAQTTEDEIEISETSSQKQAEKTTESVQ